MKIDKILCKFHDNPLQIADPLEEESEEDSAEIEKITYE